jgi:hypothetical protein
MVVTNELMSARDCASFAFAERLPRISTNRVVLFSFNAKLILLLTSLDSQVPVFNNIHNINLAEMYEGELTALISCENKAPPQLWKLEILKDRENGNDSSRLTLR